MLPKLLIPLIFIANIFVKISEIQNSFKSYLVKLFAYSIMKWIWVTIRNTGRNFRSYVVCFIKKLWTPLDSKYWRGHCNRTLLQLQCRPDGALLPRTELQTTTCLTWSRPIFSNYRESFVFICKIILSSWVSSLLQYFREILLYVLRARQWHAADQQ